MAYRMRRVGRQYESDGAGRNARLTREQVTTFGRLLRYVRPYTRWMVLSIIMLLISVSLGLILPLVIRNLVDIVLVDKNFPRLNQLAIGLFVVFLLQGVASL